MLLPCYPLNGTNEWRLERRSSGKTAHTLTVVTAVVKLGRSQFMVSSCACQSSSYKLIDSRRRWLRAGVHRQRAVVRIPLDAVLEARVQEFGMARHVGEAVRVSRLMRSTCGDLAILREAANHRGADRNREAGRRAPGDVEGVMHQPAVQVA